MLFSALKKNSILFYLHGRNKTMRKSMQRQLHQFFFFLYENSKRCFFPRCFSSGDYGRVYQGDRVLMAVRNTLFIAGYRPLQSSHHSYLFNIEKYRVEMPNFIGLKTVFKITGI